MMPLVRSLSTRLKSHTNISDFAFLASLDQYGFQSFLNILSHASVKQYLQQSRSTRTAIVTVLID